MTKLWDGPLPQNPYVQKKKNAAEQLAADEVIRVQQIIENLPAKMMDVITELPEYVQIAALEAFVKGKPVQSPLTAVSSLIQF